MQSGTVGTPTRSSPLMQLVRDGWRLGRRRFVLLLVLAVIRGAMPVVVVGTLAFAVDQVATIVRGDQSRLAPLVEVIVGQALVMSVVAVLDDLGRRRQNRLAQQTKFLLEDALFDALTSVRMLDVESPETQSALARMRTTTASLGGLWSAMFSVVTLATTSALFMLAALRVHWVVAGLLLLAVAAGPILMRGATERRFQQRRRRSRASLEVDYWLNLLAHPATALDVRAFALGPWMRRRWTGATIVLAAEDLRGSALEEDAALRTQLLSAVFGLSIVALLIWIVTQALVTIGAFVGVAAMITQSLVVGRQISQVTVTLGESVLGLSELVAFCDCAGPAPPADAVPLPELSRGVFVRDLTFSYPSTNKPALDGISCSIPAGKRTLIVGANGAGKSTLVKLLAGLYVPTSGSIHFDAIPAQRIAREGLRSGIACLLQGHLYYDASISENILMGDVVDADLHRVQAAAASSTASEFVELLPDGYNTRLGRWFWSDGFIPSEGQRVRLALARTLYRMASLYILDEPTTSLDPSAERRVLDQLARLDTTVVIVSHRPAFMAIADHVICLENGKVRAEGPPAVVSKSVPWLAQPQDIPEVLSA